MSRWRSRSPRGRWGPSRCCSAAGTAKRGRAGREGEARVSRRGPRGAGTGAYQQRDVDEELALVHALAGLELGLLEHVVPQVLAHSEPQRIQSFPELLEVDATVLVLVVRGEDVPDGVVRVRDRLNVPREDAQAVHGMLVVPTPVPELVLQLLLDVREVLLVAVLDRGSGEADLRGRGGSGALHRQPRRPPPPPPPAAATDVPHRAARSPAAPPASAARARRGRLVSPFPPAARVGRPRPPGSTPGLSGGPRRAGE